MLVGEKWLSYKVRGCNELVMDWLLFGKLLRHGPTQTNTTLVMLGRVFGIQVRELPSAQQHRPCFNYEDWPKHEITHQFLFETQPCGKRTSSS
jgi:hypothetical protein